MTTETTTVNAASTKLTSEAVMNGLKGTEADKLISAKTTVIKPKPFAPGLKTLGQKPTDALPIVAKKAPAKKAPAKKAPAKKAIKVIAKKAVKPVAKKAPAKKTAAVPTTERKTSLFSLTAKVKLDELGEGQRAAIAKVLKKHGSATRAQLIATLPNVPPANISWHLSTMIAAKLAKKAAQ